jgi:hypothetical protein
MLEKIPFFSQRLKSLEVELSPELPMLLRLSFLFNIFIYLEFTQVRAKLLG